MAGRSQEFDDDGRYMDDWKVWHNDPFQAMAFLNRVFRGCHDLLLLNEYETVADILDRVCNLKFKVIESPASEDFEDDSPFTLENAAEEGMLSLSISDIGTDWITAYVKLADRWDSPELAKRLVEILNVQILDAESNFNNMFSKTIFSRDKYLYEKKLKRQKEILLNIRMKCREKIKTSTKNCIAVRKEGVWQILTE